MPKEDYMTQQSGTIATCATYTVQPGDSLSLIAMKAYGDATKWQWIYDYPDNQQVIGNNPDLIQPGQDLFIPHPDPITPGTQYTVQAGDTLQSIAERAYCNATYGDGILVFNQDGFSGNNIDHIEPGLVLSIPPTSLFTDSGGGSGEMH
jgi:nucleoid-associated protein YgaU